MTRGYLCWLCGQQEQQQYSPYCPDCETLEHDRAERVNEYGEDYGDPGYYSEPITGADDAPAPLTDEYGTIDGAAL